MAGAGCMLGCGNAVIAAEQSPKNQTVITAPSCHSATHDCCAKRKSSTTVNIEKTSDQTFSLFRAVPEEMMGECPLAVNAIAVTASKASHHTMEPAAISRVELSSVESIDRRLDWAPSPGQFLNRGPTYLRCCVFLI